MNEYEKLLQTIEHRIEMLYSEKEKIEEVIKFMDTVRIELQLAIKTEKGKKDD